MVGLKCFLLLILLVSQEADAIRQPRARAHNLSKLRALISDDTNTQPPANTINNKAPSPLLVSLSPHIDGTPPDATQDNTTSAEHKWSEQHTHTAVTTTSAIAGNVRQAMCRNHHLKDISSTMVAELTTFSETQIIGALMKLVTNTILGPILEVLMYILMVALIVLIMELFGGRIQPLLNIMLPDIMEMMLPLQLQDRMLDPLTRALAITLTDALGSRLAKFMAPVIEEQLNSFTVFVSDPDVSHSVPHLVSGHIAGPISQHLRRELVRSLSHYITHKTTHAVIHQQYCDWCHWYNEYCEYCFYYNDLKWMHQLWSMGGDDQSGNPFGGSVSSEFV